MATRDTEMVALGDHEIGVIPEHHDDLAGLIPKDDAAAADLQRIRDEKTESVQHSREARILGLKRALLIVLFLIMLGL
jgi:hypothetical protein